VTDKDSGGPVVRALIGTALAVAVRAPLGLCPPALWAGLRLGAAAAGVVAAGVAATTVVPRVRAAMNDRVLPAGPARWLTFDIPLGTVWTEETIFRGLLQTLAVRALGPSAGLVLQAAAFGLWHIPDARKTGEPILGTVLATGLAGWVFGWLAERSGSVLAPVLAHLAINEAGAAAALVVQRG
jgi:membrane protease YdiL (CAAX protease family)